MITTLFYPHRTRVQTHVCPSEEHATAVAAYVLARYGHTPERVTHPECVTLDPGGCSLTTSAEHGTQILGTSYRIRAYHAPIVAGWISRPHTERTYGATEPVVRFAGFMRLVLIPVTHLEAMEGFLAPLVAPGDLEGLQAWAGAPDASSRVIPPPRFARRYNQDTN